MKFSNKGPNIEYFHGGAPGLEPGQSIVSASTLGLVFNYNKPWYTNQAEYDRTKVYLTTHVGLAKGYAARYFETAIPPDAGDVYLVRPEGAIIPDPDYYDTEDRGLSYLCNSAQIISVVERGVVLSKREQNRIGWPHFYWGHGLPIYEPDGQMIASAQMRQAGVSDAYMKLLPRWIDVSEIDGKGLITREGRPATVYELLKLFEHLELDRLNHQIIVHSKRQARRTGGGSRYQCTCGDQFTNKDAAAFHQVPKSELELIAEYNFRIPVSNMERLKLLVGKIASQSPKRWSWYLKK